MRDRRSSDQADGLRLFIAVDPPDVTRQRAAEIIARLRRPDRRVTWVDPGQLHLTLHFLGDGVPLAQVPDVTTAIDDVAAAFPPIKVALGGVGAFPDLTRPRVLWLGVTKGAEWLVRLQSAVGARLEALGHPIERRSFRPHLTLGRVRPAWHPGQRRGRRPSDGDELTATLAELGSEPAGDGLIDSLSLYASRLDPGGAVHERLHEAPLRGPASTP